MRIHGLRKRVLLTAAAVAVLAIHFTPRADAAPPLPFHSIEGVGGGAITPMAYLVNPEPIQEGALLGKPAFALSYVNLGQKDLDAITITETLGGRLEFGYAANRLGLGTLPSDIRDATGMDCGANHVWLHHFNMRLMAVKENMNVAGLPMPAVTAGVHFKVNDGIDDINRCLGGALSTVGYEKDNGVDFTLTTTKTLPTAALGRPLILTGGLRLSEGAQLGLLGFGNEYHATFEGNIAVMPCDRIVLAYEFRQKPDPYGQIPGLIGDEDHWHGFDVGLILNDQATFVAGYGIFGTIANTEENGVWWLQLKYEL